MSGIDKPGGLPLRQAVIRYQFPCSDEEAHMTPAQIVQQMCDMAVGWPLSPVRFLFDQDKCSFSVMSAARHGPTVGETYGTFFIGDDQPAVADLIDASPTHEIRDTIDRAFAALHADLKGALHRPWNAERVILWARRGSPFSERALVANDVVAQCEVFDWDKGHVRAGQECLFDIHVQLRELPERDQTVHVECAGVFDEPARPQRKRGRPPFDWRPGKRLCLELLDEHGLPAKSNSELPTQAALCDRVAEIMTKMHEGDPPGQTTVDGYVRAWIAEWRGLAY